MTATEPSVIALIILAAQIIGRAIPDNAEGLLGAIRRVAKIIGLYVTNK